MPMPNKRRRVDDDEVMSPGGPNDLVELPLFLPSPAASGGPAAARAGATRSPAGREGGRKNDGGGGSSGGAAALAEAQRAFKAVLVAKVLTKSDASSKRVILPRIAIEANLSELTLPGGGGGGGGGAGAHGQGRSLQFSALDAAGREWPLCIKAWANGANPKPVFVLEGGVGELIKTHRLGVGDAVGVLKSPDGRYFVHWNTEQVREAAARPTFCAFEFARHKEEEAEAARAAKEAREGEARAKAEAARAEEAGPGAVTAAAAAAGARNSGGPGGSAASEPASGTRRARAPAPPQLMTAVPVSSPPMVPGMFTPTSPCEVLVMAPPAARTDSGGSDVAANGVTGARSGGGPAAAPRGARLDAQSSALLEFSDPSVASAIASAHAEQAAAEAAAELAADRANAGDGAVAEEEGAGAGAEAGAEATGRPAAAMERVGGIVHKGGALLCPRTAGCTRPAGHQGWCIGHKGQGTKRR